MLQSSYFIAGASIALLIASAVVWTKLYRAPAAQPFNRKAPRKLVSTETASQVLVLAVGVSAIAALVAVVRFFAV